MYDPAMHHGQLLSTGLDGPTWLASLAPLAVSEVSNVEGWHMHQGVSHAPGGLSQL